MDKALQKINELYKILECLCLEKDNIKTEINLKNKQKGDLVRKQEILISKEIELDSKKKDIEYKIDNLEKWKKQRNITSFIAVSIMEFFILAISFSRFNLIPALIVSSALSTVGLPLLIVASDIHNYRWNKKYLKQNKIEDVKNDIAENNKALELNKIALDKIETELFNLLNQQNLNNDSIYLLENRIKLLKGFRNEIINEYLSNNQEFEKVVEEKYNNNKKKILNKNV